VRIVTTLLRPTEGSVRVAGVDVLRDPASARQRIGLSGQYAAVDANLTGFENLRMVARLYGMNRREATDRARARLAELGLEAAAGRRAGTSSGGMARRLDLAGALVTRPPVVVLDEPTTGLDPRGRLDMWRVIGDLVADGTTVLLTTQYLEEADMLADRIVVIDHGRVIARGAAEERKASLRRDRLTVTPAAGAGPGWSRTARRCCRWSSARAPAPWSKRCAGSTTRASACSTRVCTGRASTMCSCPSRAAPPPATPNRKPTTSARRSCRDHSHRTRAGSRRGPDARETSRHTGVFAAHAVRAGQRHRGAPHPADPPAGADAAGDRHHPAADVRVPVRLHLRRLSRWQPVPRVSARGHLHPDRRLQRRLHHRRPGG